jgi:hypothetical protein
MDKPGILFWVISGKMKKDHDKHLQKGSLKAGFNLKTKINSFQFFFLDFALGWFCISFNS